MKRNLYMFVGRTIQGMFDISSNFASPMMYMGYSKREAIKLYRESHGVKGKHITIVHLS